MAKSTLKNYIEAGAQFTEMPRQQAEAFVKGLVKSGEIRRRDAEVLLQTLLARGRETSDRFTALVQAEVARQVTAMSERFDELERRLEALSASIRSSVVGDGVSTAADAEPEPAAMPVAEQLVAETSGAEKSAANKSAVKKSATKKSGAKKSGAKKSGAKKSASKRSTAKRSGGKRSTAKRSQAAESSSDAVGSSGVRKVSTTRPASAPE
jgi:polyhydroxyalkanoate synthesis regulator phasin